MKELILLSGFAVFFLPLLPAVIEVIKSRGKDAELYINIKYTKNPSYFADSFKKKISDIILSNNWLDKKVIKTKLSKEELIVFGKMNFLKSVLYKECIYVLFGENNIKKGSYLKKEIISTGNLTVGEDSVLRAVVSNESIILGENVQILRWIDAKNIYTQNGCMLGVSCSAKENIKLASNVRFTRLYGFPITTDSNGITYGEKTLLEESLYQKEINISFPQMAVIKGDLFAEKSIRLKNVKIYGNVFCQGDIYLENIELGDENKYYSIIGRRIFIRGHLKAFGYIQSEYMQGFVL